MRSRSLLLTVPERLEWVERDLSPTGAHDVLVEMRSGAISSGATGLPGLDRVDMLEG